MEIAYVSANKIHIEIEKKQNNFLATILKKITKRPSKFIATMLVGNNIALVVYGFFMGDVSMLSRLINNANFFSDKIRMMEVECCQNSDQKSNYLGKKTA